MPELPRVPEVPVGFSRFVLLEGPGALVGFRQLIGSPWGTGQYQWEAHGAPVRIY